MNQRYYEAYDDYDPLADQPDIGGMNTTVLDRQRSKRRSVRPPDPWKKQSQPQRKPPAGQRPHVVTPPDARENTRGYIDAVYREEPATHSRPNPQQPPSVPVIMQRPPEPVYEEGPVLMTHWFDYVTKYSVFAFIILEVIVWGVFFLRHIHAFQ